MDASGTEASLCDRKAVTFFAEKVIGGHLHVLVDHLRVAAPIGVPEDVRVRASDTPGVSLGTTIIDCWRCWGPSGSVLPMTMRTLHRSEPPRLS